MEIQRLSELSDGQEADFFALLSEKQGQTTRDGKPYFRVTFRDDQREVSFPIWNDSPLHDQCRDAWQPGIFYKLRASYRDTNYGPQLNIRQIREVTDADRDEGFHPGMCSPSSRRDPESMYHDLIALIEEHIPPEREKLLELVTTLMEENRELWLRAAAAKRYHHMYVGGLLEHTLSVTRTAAYLAERYADEYEDLQPGLDVPLVVAGAALHDVGKLLELNQTPTGAEYTPSGEMIGHLLLGRDMVRDLALQIELDEETRLRLEHLVIAHQRLPEWGSPKPPMTPEALLIHYADDTDAKFNIMYHAMTADTTDGPFTSSKNLMHHKIFRGLDG